MKVYTIIPVIVIYLFFGYGMFKFVEQERESVSLQDGVILKDIEKMITKTEKKEIRKELLNEIITGFDQLIELLKTGGQARLTGHSYNPEENNKELKLLEQLKQGLIEMRDKE